MTEPLLIDIHSHVNFAAFKEDGDLVLQRALEKNIWVINVGSQLTTSQRAVDMAERYGKGVYPHTNPIQSRQNSNVQSVAAAAPSSHEDPQKVSKIGGGVYAIVGLHPVHLEEQELDEEETHFTTRGEVFDPERYKVLAKNPRVVAIGECGLDYFRLEANQREGEREPTRIGNAPQPPLKVRGGDEGGVMAIKERQREALIQQIELANEATLPVMFHIRASKENPEDAYLDLIEIIKKHPPKAGGDMHCFSGSKEIAQKFLDVGLHLSFTGIVTFKNAEALREVVRYVPLKKMMVETDSPYLAPEPYRGKRCEPSYVEYTARKIAEVKGLTFEEVAWQTTENAMKLFKLKI